MNPVKQAVLELLHSVVPEALDDDVKSSPLGGFGSPIAFRLAKKLGSDPRKIAADLASKIIPSGFVESVSADGGYVNFALDYSAVLKHLMSSSAASKPCSGSIVLEHTSVNPTGPVHVGRIRNTIIGDSVKRILLHIGYDVETHYYVNDVGKQVAIIAVGLSDGLQSADDVKAKYGKYVGRGDYRLFFTYVVANRLYEEDEAFQKRVTCLIQAAEAGDKKSLEKITSTAREGLAGQLETFKRLGVSFDVFDFESEGLTDGSVATAMDVVKKSPYFVEDAVGSGVDLSSFGIDKRSGLTVLARSDGTSVYLARDIAYHLKKIGLGDRLINVLGEDHKLQFQELKTILSEIFKVSKPIDVVHFSFVNFEGVKFSTRKGDIATVDELLDEAVEKALEEVKKRGLGDEETARMVGVGAMKFHIVKTSPNKQITFRFSDALNFDGETAPYIQYAHARSCRILEKAGFDGKVGDIDFEVTETDEQSLIMRLLEFDDVVLEAGASLRPDIVASYLVQLTSDYGRFYMSCPVIDSLESVRNRRLLLVERVRDTIKAGLGLLGIEAPDRM